MMIKVRLDIFSYDFKQENLKQLLHVIISEEFFSPLISDKRWLHKMFYSDITTKSMFANFLDRVDQDDYDNA